MNPVLSGSRSGSRLLTYVPSPCLTSSTRSCDSARTASRSELRESPSWAANSLSLGRRSPGPQLPETMSSRILSIASSVTLRGRVTLRARLTLAARAPRLLPRCDDGPVTGRLSLLPPLLHHVLHVQPSP